MATVEFHSEIPANIVCLPLSKRQLIRKHYEQGDLVILSDVKIKADFDRIASAKPPSMGDVRKQKFIFRKSVEGRAETRASTWKSFFGDRLTTDPVGCRSMQDEIMCVDMQVDALIKRIFDRYEFSRDFTAWKFLEITGENLHIDNLPNLNETTQVRLFVNMDNRPRRWSVGRHLRHYAERYFNAASLADVAQDAFAFNGRLNHTAFGPSWATCEEPRHLIEFDPGEVWLINSALTAHQVRDGRRLCSAHYEYPYRACRNQAETLPHLIREMNRKHASEPRNQTSILGAGLACLKMWI